MVLVVSACALLCCEAPQLHASPKSQPSRPGPSAVSKPLQPSAAAAEPNSKTSAHIRYLAVGGGATPEYTEVSLEQDLQLAQQILPGPGQSLFAGGEQSASVRVQGAPPSATQGSAAAKSLVSRLGDLFDPRAARDSHYRKTQVSAQAASALNFESTLKAAVRAGSDPLLIYISAHGLQGDTPRDNHVELWAAEPITVAHLDELISGATRPLRFLIASCYSGGFAELAFAQADPEHGPADASRCGLFAGTWDRQTSGCDPNPDRRAQEGYSLHLLHALRGQDREGNALPIATLDLDGDGKVSLLEAHTRARITSHSIDVPTTTSERYLREITQQRGVPALSLLPEDAAVVKQLGTRLGLANVAAAEKRFKDVGQRLDALQDELDAADRELERARSQLAAQLLARWPVLNDAYHDDFAVTVAAASKEIEAVLEHSAASDVFRRAHAHTEKLSLRANTLDVDEAEALRLVRAYETLALAGTLAARADDAFAHYRALLSCERSVP